MYAPSPANFVHHYISFLDKFSFQSVNLCNCNYSSSQCSCSTLSKERVSFAAIEILAYCQKNYMFLEYQPSLQSCAAILVAFRMIPLNHPKLLLKMFRQCLQTELTILQQDINMMAIGISLFGVREVGNFMLLKPVDSCAEKMSEYLEDTGFLIEILGDIKINR